MFFIGEGIEKNIKKGIKYIFDATENGEIDAMFFLYQFCSNEIFKEDYKEIFENKNKVLEH